MKWDFPLDPNSVRRNIFESLSFNIATFLSLHFYYFAIGSNPHSQHRGTQRNSILTASWRNSLVLRHTHIRTHARVHTHTHFLYTMEFAWQTEEKWRRSRPRILMELDLSCIYLTIFRGVQLTMLHTPSISDLPNLEQPSQSFPIFKSYLSS